MPHTIPTTKDMRSSGEHAVTDGAQRLDNTEAVAARSWWAAICRTDASATIRIFTDLDSSEVWLVCWNQPVSGMMFGDVGESLSSLLIHCHRTATGRAD